MKKPFLDLTLSKPFSRNTMMNILKCYLEKHIGKPCPDYAPGCMSCSCWIAFAQLDEAFMDYEPKKAKKK